MKQRQKTLPETKEIFRRTPSLRDVVTHYCAGCGHGIVHRLIAETIDEMGLRERTIGVAPVGCAVLAYDYWDFDVVEAAHGRAPAVATGVKRVHPGLTVFTYQGDGDLAAIGTAEIVHAANRAEPLTVIFVNNGVYGMTGGQMAPTTLIGQTTTTTQRGRQIRRDGFPIKISEMLALLPGVRYVERVSVHAPQEVLRAKRAIKKAFGVQQDGKGFALVEVLSPCPVQWGVSPLKALARIKEQMQSYYPIGVIKGY